MQVTHDGYGNPDVLRFEDITVMGVPQPPISVSVSHVSGGTTANSTVPTANIQYDEAKKVNTLKLT